MGVLTVFEGVFCIKPLHARTFDVWRIVTVSGASKNL